MLLEKLESKTKGTVLRLFAYKTVSFIKCKRAACMSLRVEMFYNSQFIAKGKQNSFEWFKVIPST